jgi:outer membrane protein OmpA-like peptidoglycan-associated protein
MKISTLLTAVTLVSVCSSADAQNWADRLKEKAENAAKRTVEDNVERKTEQAVDNAMNPGRNKDKNSNKGKNNQSNDNDYNESENQVDNNAPKSDPRNPKAQISWNSYDFVAGDEIIFEDDQANEQVGEFPAKWDGFGGYAQIAQLNGVKCISLSDDGSITPLFNDNKPYLTDQFTIEYDVYIVYGPDYNTEFNPHGWRMYTYLPSGDKIKHEDNGFNFDHQVSTGEDAKTLDDAILGYYWHVPNSDEVRNGDARLDGIAISAWHHVAISFNKRAYKVYFDEKRVINIPNASKPSFFWISCNQHEPVFFIKNVRIAKGAVPLYDRMASDGKIITYGITFDIGKATIKPESMGEINRFVKLMQDNPDLKFEVQGHTDNTGSAATNQTLSEQRAKAIVAKMVELGIPASRLTSVGKGASAPIADNSTDEGRAKNRRVEFVKK